MTALEPDAPWAYFLVFVATMAVLYAVAFGLGIRMKLWLSQARVERLLARRSPWSANAAAALFGALTPFCSCTTVPIFAGMLESDVRLGSAMSFLIASPTINPPALVLLLAVFGWKLTLYYCAAVAVVALAGGAILGQRRLTGLVYEFLFLDDEGGRVGWRALAAGYGRFLKRFAPAIVIAAAIATVLRGWVPSDRVLLALSGAGLLSVPLVVGLGAALYADVILLIPIAHTLVLKGVPEGTVVAFTMAASGLGLPSLLLLSRLLHRKLIAIYVVVLVLLLVGVGYSLNLLV